MFDKHFQIIFSWWLPQIIEILSTFQSNYDRYDLSILINLFRKHSAIALFLMTGEYLIAGITIPNAGQSNDKQLKIQSDKIKQQCKNYTQSLRNLIVKSKKFGINNDNDIDKSNKTTNNNKLTTSNSNRNLQVVALSKTNSRNQLRRTKSHELHAAVSRDLSTSSFTHTSIGDLDSSLRPDDNFDDLVCFYFYL